MELPPAYDSNQFRAGSVDEQGQSAHRILKMYAGLSYFDQYGGSVMIFLLLTILDMLGVSYFHIMANVAPIREDWGNQKCKPLVIPFAGMINKPDGMTASEFTQQNFSSCMQSILQSITGYFLEPLTYVVSSLTEVYALISEALQAIRVYVTNIRYYISSIAEQILSRILNVMVPIQQIIIALKDIMGKVNGVMTSGLYMSLGVYDTLRSLLGAVVQLIIIIIAVLAILIASLFSISWFFPPAAIMAMTTSLVLIAVTIPMAIILVFLEQNLHISAPRTWRR